MNNEVDAEFGTAYINTLTEDLNSVNQQRLIAQTRAIMLEKLVGALNQKNKEFEIHIGTLSEQIKQSDKQKEELEADLSNTKQLLKETTDESNRYLKERDQTRIDLVAVQNSIRDLQRIRTIVEQENEQLKSNKSQKKLKKTEVNTSV